MGKGACVTTHQPLGFLPLWVALSVIGGCGIVGPPIAPENVGVAPIIERQKKQHAQQAGQDRRVSESAKGEVPELVEPRGQDEELPPLRPVGTR